ncbi:LOW QUALITY PROTEIN: UDP-glycosyltransferase 89B2-like [Setaria italica]|uniref:LOW QUALITY PROTEIN: UDP-glycosyltransferase 89B2-like n=1 Tax=Setaria italica TaxID=4555 RepID=UPI000BE53D99|nr:LOW QUALITY PROTEIN: UDP-glycosyltransferase 89B2-like [Setaria italica]
MAAPPQKKPASNGRCRDGEPHVLLVPYPAQGHMLPLLDLAALLAARGLAVTIAATAGNAPLLQPLLAAWPSVGVTALPFPAATPLLPAGGGENTKDLPRHLFRPFMVSLAALRAPLLAWCRAQHQQGRSVTAVVSDFFTGWTQPLAAELGVPHVTFSPSCALHLAMSHSLWRHLPSRRRPGDAHEAVTFPEIPGSPCFPWRQLSGLFRQYVARDEVSEAIRQLFLWNLDSACFVVNSFRARAPYVVRPLPDLASKRVLAVGPLSDAVATSVDRGGKPAVAAASVAAWLNAFPDGSVVYVSFGTQHVLSPPQAASVADALARSSAAFVWAARPGTAVPDGFEAATASRGMVIRGWAPQVEILRHRAVGWFLTHCGWNSVLEAAAAGVAMLAWPMGADQFTDARLLAEAGVAVPVAEGADAVPDAGKMASAIAAAVGKGGKPVRERAAELGRKAAAAVAEGGSSRRDLEELVQMLTKVV